MALTLVEHTVNMKGRGSALKPHTMIPAAWMRMFVVSARHRHRRP